MTTLKILMIISVAIFFIDLALSLDDNCCDQLYLSSSGPIEIDYSYLLGIYIKEGVIKDRAYYGKNFTFPLQNGTLITVTYYLIYADENEYNAGNSGWTISQTAKPLHESPNEKLNPVIFSDQTQPKTLLNQNNAISTCPEEDVFSGWRFWNQFWNKDTTFKIDCHTDHILVDCNCTKLEVKSSNISSGTYPALTMGVYQLQNGSFNGHPYYEHMDELNSIETMLYYEKKGTTNDGWSIKVTEKLTQAGNTAAHAIPPIITTQIQKPCPQAIIRGFINQVDIDPTLRIVCLVETNKNFTTTMLNNNDNKNHPKKEKTTEEEKQTSNIIMDYNDMENTVTVLTQTKTEKSVKHSQQQQQQQKPFETIQAQQNSLAAAAASPESQLMPKFVTAIIICLVIYLC